MDKAYSGSWKSSKLPRKQRKYKYNAPLHIRSKFMTSPLSKDLRTKHKKRSMRVRVGDKVKIMRGQFKGKEGKIDSVDLQNIKVNVEKIEVVKKDGSKAFYPIQPSNIMITELTDDKKRLKRQGVTK